MGGAGIGGGGAEDQGNNGGEGSYITITGGKVTATGRQGGAGIGGGGHLYLSGSGGGMGSNIVITGGTITAIGGHGGAGIGGKNGSIITISGGIIIAVGGNNGAGIGGGVSGTGSDITIGSNAKVMAAGGAVFSGYGAGAAIGNGGENGSDGTEIDPDTYKSGLYDTGYIKYYAGGTGVDAIINEAVDPVKYITASIITTKTITFDANGGSCDTTTAATVSSNGSQVLSSLPDATRENYRFDGWYTEASGGDPVTLSTEFTTDTTVYAHWIYDPPAPATYTITFDANGGTVSPASGTTGTDGKLVSLPAPEREGYTFTGWFTEKEGGTQVTVSTVFTSNTTVFAHWTDNPPAPAAYTITFDANGGTVSPASGTTGTDGKLASLPAPNWDGHTFTGWFTEKEGGTQVTVSTVFSKNDNVYAHWEKTSGGETPATEPTTPAPESENQTPGSETPATEDVKPAPESENPAPGPETPATEDVKPAPESGNQAPGPETPAPESGNQVPGAETPAPESGNQAPGPETPAPEPENPAPKPTVPKETVITVSDNKPMAVSAESKGEFNISYAHEIPFFGKGKITPEYFGGLSVSQGNATYNVTKIKVNKKSSRIQITGLQGADKATVKKVKKATKGSNGLPFTCNPYYVRDTDKATLKFNKNGELKSVMILINSKEYKAKKDEFSYDSSTKQILFKGSNLSGSYQTR